jgi:hypothetical protein
VSWLSRWWRRNVIDDMPLELDDERRRHRKRTGAPVRCDAPQCNRIANVFRNTGAWCLAHDPTMVRPEQDYR